MPYRVPPVDEEKARDEEEVAAFALELQRRGRGFRTVWGMLAVAAVMGWVALLVATVLMPVFDGTLWIWASGQSAAEPNLHIRTPATSSEGCATVHDRAAFTTSPDAALAGRWRLA